MHMKIRLFHVEQLTVGEHTLPEAESHYLCRVLRVRAKSEISLFNSRDGEWRARITAVHPKQTRIVLETCLRSGEVTAELTLIFAPIKKSRISTIFAMATELGTSHIQPLTTRYTHADVGRVEQVQRQLIEPTEQCERLDVPALLPTLSWAQFVAQQQEDPKPLLACLERGDARPMREILQPCPSTIPRQILIGPEGGFSFEECAELESWTHCHSVSLGGRILRSETAAAAALAQWQALIGDAATRPPTP